MTNNAFDIYFVDSLDRHMTNVSGGSPRSTRLLMISWHGCSIFLGTQPMKTNGLLFRLTRNLPTEPFPMIKKSSMMPCCDFALCRNTPLAFLKDSFQCYKIFAWRSMVMTLAETVLLTSVNILLKVRLCFTICYCSITMKFQKIGLRMTLLHLMIQQVEC